MTRDERTAISILNAYKAGYESGMEDSKQEPCEDAVSRDAVNALYDKYRPSLATHVSEFGDELKALPSVTPTVDLSAYSDKLWKSAYERGKAERQTGKWIKDTETYAGDHLSNYKCSLCGEIAGSWVQGLTQDKLFKFCPNCGADMRKGENE